MIIVQEKPYPIVLFLNRNNQSLIPQQLGTILPSKKKKKKNLVFLNQTESIV